MPAVSESEQPESKQTDNLPAKPRTSKLAIAAFIFGLLSVIGFMFWPLQILPAVICGLVALYKINHSKGKLAGGNYAVAGILISLFILAVIPMLIGGLFPIHHVSDKARIVMTKAALQDLHNAVNWFKEDTDRYPTNEEGLGVLIKKTR